MRQQVVDNVVLHIDGETRQVNARAKAGRMRMPPLGKRRCRTSMVLECGVLDESRLFVASEVPRDCAYSRCLAGLLVRARWRTGGEVFVQVVEVANRLQALAIE